MFPGKSVSAECLQLYRISSVLGEVIGLRSKWMTNSFFVLVNFSSAAVDAKAVGPDTFYTFVLWETVCWFVRTND